MCLTNLKQFLMEGTRSPGDVVDEVREGKKGVFKERRRNPASPRGLPSGGWQRGDMEGLNQLRLQHLQMLTGAESSCVLFQDSDNVEPLFWFDSTEPERVALAASVRLGLLPEGWESIAEREGDFAVVLCLKRAIRNDLKAIKTNLIHWFAAQKFQNR